MGFDDCFELGYVIKTHGLRGEVQWMLDVDNPAAYTELESVFIDINGKLVPFFIESFLPQGDKAIVALEDVESLDAAQVLVGKALYLPLAVLPALPDHQYYFHDLVGMDVWHADRLIGTVTQVYELPLQNLLAVDHQGTEVLIPLEDAIVTEVNKAERKIRTDLPDGLLDVYLNP